MEKLMNSFSILEKRNHMLFHNDQMATEDNPQLCTDSDSMAG